MDSQYTTENNWYVVQSQVRRFLSPRMNERLRSMRKRNAILLLLLALLAWKLVRTDWIVSTHYWFYDSDPPPSESISIQTFTPPVSPLWHPPQPRDIEPTATTWRHPDFFAMGGASGPTEDPRLHVNWPLLLIKLTCGAVAGYVVIVLAFRLFNRRAQPTGSV